jgi:hypothetical protein
MTAEEYTYSGNKPILSDAEGETIRYILDCLKSACKPFKKASSQTNLRHPLNENKLTQIYVEQVEVYVKLHPNIGIKNQYSDTFHGTKGIPDFYFHKVEEGAYHEPLFIGEAKILPSPGGKIREKEYVIGASNNGGIERYKTEMHGKGLNDCGIVGFIQKEKPKHWEKTINNWIQDLASNDKSWNVDEILSIVDSNVNYYFLKSICHRKTGVVNLTHLWVNLKEP